ncbi:MAG: DUF6445 family protein [Acidobacteriota bacterium]|nr:DUF6445 family protein [Acidobacteriota bacterium]
MTATTTALRLSPLIELDRLALNERGEIDVSFVGVAGTKALVVDNLYREPDYVRSLALGLNYHRPAGMYPGFFAFVSVSTRPLLDLANDLMRETIGGELAFTPFYQDDIAFAVITRRGSELVPAQRKPHFDDFCDYAGLVYLNTPDQCSGGTSFWRHRATGLRLAARGEGAESLPALLARFGVADEQALAKRILGEANPDLPEGYPTGSTSAWELTDVIEMRYNRLVVYDSLLFHTPHYHEERFGETVETRRLTQNLYFNFRKKSGVRKRTRARS